MEGGVDGSGAAAAARSVALCGFPLVVALWHRHNNNLTTFGSICVWLGDRLLSRSRHYSKHSHII